MQHFAQDWKSVIEPVPSGSTYVAAAAGRVRLRVRRLTEGFTEKLIRTKTMLTSRLAEAHHRALAEVALARASTSAKLDISAVAVRTMLRSVGPGAT